jgi:hypothetical protein
MSRKHKGKAVPSTDEVRQKLMEAEQATKESQSGKGRKKGSKPPCKRQRIEDGSSSDLDDEGEDI